jgi:hypothetical protein
MTLEEIHCSSDEAAEAEEDGERQILLWFRHAFHWHARDLIVLGQAFLHTTSH